MGKILGVRETVTVMGDMGCQVAVTVIGVMWVTQRGNISHVRHVGEGETVTVKGNISEREQVTELGDMWVKDSQSL